MIKLFKLLVFALMCTWSHGRLRHAVALRPDGVAILHRRLTLGPNGTLYAFYNTIEDLKLEPCIEVLDTTTKQVQRQCGGVAVSMLEPQVTVHRVSSKALHIPTWGLWRCGNDDYGWSSWNSIHVAQHDSSQINVLVVGDLGFQKALTFPDIKGETPFMDAVIDLGDIGYDLADLHGRRTLQFLELVEPVTSSVPFLATPGNHEAKFNFSHYRSVFGEDTLYYSRDLGKHLHMTFFSSELFYWPEYYQESHVKVAIEWLKDDLAKNVDKRWKLFITHRPMYCPSGGSCDWECEAMRRGALSYCLNDNPWGCKPLHDPPIEFGLEEILNAHTIDLVVSGHQHSYFRTKHLFNRTESSPGAVHVVSGAGGNKFMNSKDPPRPPGPCIDSPYCVFQSGASPGPGQGHDFSYSLVSLNETDLHWQQYSVIHGEFVDEWYLHKDDSPSRQLGRKSIVL